MGLRDVQATKSLRENLSSFLSVSSAHVYHRELRYGDIGQGYEWGFQIHDEVPRYQWFKLELDPSQTESVSELARRFPARKALPPGYNADVKTLVTDYLTALRQHTELFLKHKLPQAALRSTAIEYIIT